MSDIKISIIQLPAAVLYVWLKVGPCDSPHSSGASLQNKGAKWTTDGDRCPGEPCFFNKDAVETTWNNRFSPSHHRAESCACLRSVSPSSLAVSKPLWIWAKTSVAVWEAAAAQQRNGTSASSLSSGSRLNGQKLAAIGLPVPKRWSITCPLQRIPAFYRFISTPGLQDCVGLQAKGGDIKTHLTHIFHSSRH